MPTRRPLDRERRVLHALATHQNLTEEQIAHVTGLSASVIQTLARSLRKIGDLTGDRDPYEYNVASTRYGISSQGLARLELAESAER